MVTLLPRCRSGIALSLFVSIFGFSLGAEEKGPKAEIVIFASGAGEEARGAADELAQDDKPAPAKDGEKKSGDDKAAPAVKKPKDLTGLSLEELLGVKVTSASRKEERVSDTTAAVYVLSNEDIRRSGATHVAEALRMVPGLYVARRNSNRWGITSRGFLDIFSNKLLVMIDGRTVYSPFFSGVYWDAQDVMLEDVERVEVVRGPGGAVWGANAVNGVINIITKSSQETQGGVVSALGGNEDRAITSVRYGGSYKKDVTWRVYAKYADRDDSLLRGTSRDAKDEWENVRGGFKADWVASKDDTLTFQGDHYRGKNEEGSVFAQLTPPFTRSQVEDTHFSGSNLLARWQHRFSDCSNMNLQAYWDRAEREEAYLDQFHETGDIDFNHHMVVGDHDIVYGAGYRVISEDFGNKPTVQVRPDSDLRHLFSLFAQDEITIVKDRLKATIGSKFERNDITGFEIQPTFRLLWTPHRQHSVWAAVSRAVRTTTRNEYDTTANVSVAPLPDGSVSLVRLLPHHAPGSETVIANELGYRAQLHKRFSLDFASFYNFYDHLRTFENGAPFPEAVPVPAHLVAPLFHQDNASGESYGAELAASANPVDRWRLSAGYSAFFLRIHRDPSSNDPSAETQERSNPQNQFNVRSYLNLPHKIELDTALYYVDHIPQFKVPSYVRLDVRVGWRPTKDLELSISGQNLLDNRHPESEQSIFERAAEIQRSFHIRLTWKF